MIQQNSAESLIPNALQGVEEQPFFFENTKTGANLFGILYISEKPLDVGIVFLHPIGPERNTCDTVPVNIARSLAAQGIVCLRFDYTGTGDSEGEFKDITKRTLLTDVESAITTIKTVEGVKSVGLFGLRFGGMLASFYAEQADSNLEQLILCSPVVDFSDYINKALMMSITSQAVMFGKVIADRETIMKNLVEGLETVHEGFNLSNLDGFPLSQGLLLSFTGHNLINEVGSYKHRCLVIDLSIPGKRKDASVSKLAAKYGDDCYTEISVKYLPWILNNLLVTSIPELNECVTTWVTEGIG